MFLYSVAQEPHVLSIGKNEGVESSMVYNIYQDTKGYIWFASEAGLVQYDGNVSRYYTHPEFDAGAGTSIREDIYGRIWYTTFKGHIFYVEDDTLHYFSKHTPKRFTPIGITKKYLFAFSDSDLHVYDLKYLQHVKTIRNSSIYIQHATSDSIYFYYTQESSFYKIDSNLEVSSSNLNRNVYATTNKIYSYNGKIYLLSFKSNRYTLYVYDHNFNILDAQVLEIEGSINDLVFINKQLYIIGSKGLDIFSLTPDGFPMADIRSSRLKRHNISSVIKDAQGSYWISTLWGGVYMIPDIESKKYQLESEFPICLTGSGGELWISTHRGSIFSFDDKLLNFRRVYTELMEDGIYYLHYDEASQLLMYSSRGFRMLNTKDYRVMHTTAFPVKSIVRLDDNYLLAGTSLDLLLVRNPLMGQKKSSVWDSLFHSQSYPHHADYSSIIHNVWNKAVAYDEDAGIAYALEDYRIYRITPKGSSQIELSKANIVFSDMCLHEGVVYVLSTEGDVYVLRDDNLEKLSLRYKGKRIHVVKLRSFSRGLIFSDGKNLFVTSGEQQVKKIVIRSRDFSISDYYATEKEVFITTSESLIQVPFNISDREDYIPRFYIRSVLANGVPISLGNSIYLGPEVTEIGIHFSLIDYSKVSHGDFYYQINSGAWVQIPQGQSQLTFPSLASGDYLIRFKASDIIFPQTLAFSISKPIWKQLWFILIIVFIVVIVVYLYYKWQVGLLRNKIVLLNDKVQLEKDLGKMALTSIKSQMNPHFFYNALNTIQAYIFTNDKKNASGYLAKFSTLTRMILDMSEREWVSLNEEITALNLYLELENMRFTEKIQYELVYNELDTDSIRLPSMLIQPYVENAVKHGLLHKVKDRKLQILFYVESEVLYIRIEDNGIGRQRAMEIRGAHVSGHTSFSTQANQRRLDILNRMRNRKVSVEFTDLYDTHGSASGTVVTLSIPIDIYGN